MSSVISNDMPKTGSTVTHTVTTKRRSLYHSNSSESLRPAIKRVSCCAAAVSTTANTNLKMRSHTPTMDAVDFDNLPPAVRRKYFSSLERLRYAQQHQHQNGVSSFPSSNHGRTMSSASGKFTRLGTKSRPSYDSFRSTHTPPRPAGLCKSNPEANAFLLSQADAKWYLELPETIRRKHFSREERILLATKCESIIVDAADEAIYRMGRHANRSLDTLDSHRSSVSGFRDSIYDRDAMNAVEEIRKSFRWLDEDGALDLRLGEFYCSGSNKFEKHSAPSRSSHKRTQSLSGRTFRTHSSSSSVPTTGRPSLGSRHPTSHGMNTARHQPSFSQSINSMDTDAAYYQDPEARLKLRVYLASPQKFDEAVEFGFPSTAESKGFSKTRPRTATIRKIEPEIDDLPSKERDHQFNDLDNVSMAVGDVMDYQKMRELEEQTPSAVMPSRISNVSVFDPYPHASPGNREMTLRMTLTRKDLRADENELYGWRKSDPLALEDLPPASDSDAGQFDWGHSGRGSQTGLKKLWRKMRGLR
ncbi:hypothetical protein L873DRAFT_1067240 [Choiromyces venosus 120613-1]|uniref:Mucin n=1 Tax=Choiromyces venosus 120613-1 TaxID=1336337 RepID=A0A3N4JIG0_9PEZI|nr:hypothetical protein L873DRAFT_1067240 [Choiromyces venosus 120613-1]